jgi:PadR family transcriptional regulator, regulatory protein PadR
LTYAYLYFIVVYMSSSLGEFEQMVLLAILRLGDEAYGVAVREEIRRCTGREVAPGALYTSLGRMEDKGLLRARVGEPTAERGGRAKRYLRVTSAGRTALVGAQRAYQSLMLGLDLLKTDAGGSRNA